MAAPTYTLLNTVITSNVDASSYTSASNYSPTANKICFAVVFNERLTNATPATPSVSAGGVTGWSQLTTDVRATNQRLTWFSGVAPSSVTPAQLVIDFGGETQTRCSYAVIQGDNITLSGTNGNDSFVQAASSYTSGNSALSATLPVTWAAVDNNALVAAWVGNSSLTITWGSGFTALGQNSASGNSLAIGYGRDSDDVIDATLAGTLEHQVLVMEIEALIDSIPLVQRSAFATRRFNGRLI